MDSAFLTAARTLERRITQLGGTHPGIVRWVAAQDVVFENCDNGNRPVPPPEPGLPEALARDREYQMAAALLWGQVPRGP